MERFIEDVNAALEGSSATTEMLFNDIYHGTKNRLIEKLNPKTCMSPNRNEPMRQKLTSQKAHIP